jgi:16S rRNA (cytidine1402-2'-O)-methyltransferase
MFNSTLFIVSTPIGNLLDISKRSVFVLKGVDLIIVENIRFSYKIMSYLKLRNKVSVLNKECEFYKIGFFVSLLLKGLSIAIISSAGTPAISDPGSFFINIVRKYSIKVCVIPGACAFVSALSCYGSFSSYFIFGGYFPQKYILKISVLKFLLYERKDYLFYESCSKICIFSVLIVYNIYNFINRAYE